ncbi:RBBP9/YdeN family alpha/beta hydrolase, partial [Bordetella avium]
MRLQPIIIPGWKDSGPGHWQTLWADSLPHARRLSQRDWQNPDRNAWIAALSTAVNEATAPVMLIAHSL